MALQDIGMCLRASRHYLWFVLLTICLNSDVGLCLSASEDDVSGKNLTMLVSMMIMIRTYDRIKYIYYLKECTEDQKYCLMVKINLLENILIHTPHDGGVFAYFMKEWKSWVCWSMLLLLLEGLLIYYMSVVKDLL